MKHSSTDRRLGFGDFEDDEVGMDGLQGAQLGDEGGRPVASVGGEADEDGVALSDLTQ